jgi:thioredoxin reductase (NADPH)
MYDVVIIGSGPAGFSAAIYAGRSMLSALLITGSTPGGWAALTDKIENYPGFPEGIAGPDLVERMQQQAQRFGAEIVLDEVTSVDFESYPFKLETYSETYEAKAIVVATGVSQRMLDVPGEIELAGKGVSRCATCDGFFFRDKKIVVVGGGDSAIEEGIYLTRYARELYVVHRRSRLRAQKVAQERAFKNEKMHFIWNTIVTEILGKDHVTGVRLRNVVTGEESIFDCDAVFIYIGNVPNTDLFENKLELDDFNYIVADMHGNTSVPGVFAAGDVCETELKQIVTAVGSGARAAMQAEEFIAAQEDRIYPERDLSAEG